MSLHLIEAVHGTDRKPRTTEQWEDIARLNSQKFTQSNSHSPLAWVLVRGKNIPPNAIVAGEDKRQPLFIARAFWEGSVHVGKAGHHLERGASFAYNGREINVDVYEVLVPLELSVRYAISDTYHIPSIPRLAKSNEMSYDSDLIQRLRQIKVVMVLDDSDSMAGTLWSQARSALTGLIQIMEQDFQTNGIDLYFLNHPTFEYNLKDRMRIQNIIDSVVPNGSTPAGRKLQEIFTTYLPQVGDGRQPPTVVVVITDGVPTDDLVSVLVDGARRLDRTGVPLNRFGVSFVQIGDDPDAAEFLRELDDDLGPRHGVRDMVDATPYDPNNVEFTRETLVKCILGSIDPVCIPDINSLKLSNPRATTPGMGIPKPMQTNYMPAPMMPGFAHPSSTFN